MSYREDLGIDELVARTIQHSRRQRHLATLRRFARRALEAAGGCPDCGQPWPHHSYGCDVGDALSE